jgi:uncharacterized protein YegP (UPF0339 family)
MSSSHQSDDYNLSQKSQSSKAGFESFKGEDGRYYFHFNDQTGTALLFSQAYMKTAERDVGIKSVQKNAVIKARYETINEDDKHYFVLRAGNNFAIGRSRFFKTKAEMEVQKQFLNTYFVSEVDGKGVFAEVAHADTRNILANAEPLSEAVSTFRNAENEALQSRIKELEKQVDRLEKSKTDVSDVEKTEMPRQVFRIEMYKNDTSKRVHGKIIHPLSTETRVFSGVDVQTIEEFINEKIDSTTEILLNSTTEILSNSTTEILSNSTTEILPNSTTEILPNSTTEILPNSTTEILPNSTTEILPNLTTKILPNSTTEILPNSLAEFRMKSAAEFIANSKNELVPNVKTELVPNAATELMPNSTNISAVQGNISQISVEQDAPNEVSRVVSVEKHKQEVVQIGKMRIEAHSLFDSNSGILQESPFELIVHPELKMGEKLRHCEQYLMKVYVFSFATRDRFMLFERCIQFDGNAQNTLKTRVHQNALPKGSHRLTVMVSEPNQHVNPALRYYEGKTWHGEVIIQVH